MKKVEVTVLPDPEEFYLACSTGWAKVAGHLIIIDDLHFSAIPIKNFIRISEFESGAKLIDIPVPETIESYNETLIFLETIVSANIVLLLEKVGIEKVKSQIDFMKETAFKNLGQRPIGQKISSEWITADVSDVLN